MSLDNDTVARASRALRGYSMSERVQDRADALAALSELVLLAEIDGNDVAEAQLREALELAAIGPACANEADNILSAVTQTE